MGMGDEILATGQARRAGEPCQIISGRGAQRWVEIWRDNPLICRPGQKGLQVRNGPSARPYIDYVRSREKRWVWNEAFEPTPGDLPWCSPDSRGEGGIVVEPHLKRGASPNKDWGWHRWQEMINRRPDLPWIQMGRPGTVLLDGVRFVPTDSFEAACRVLMAARCSVLPEGGLHHAAAALGRPAVVLFGSYITPAQTGYAMHRNLWVDDPEGLGWRTPSDACKRAWEAITPELVLTELEDLLCKP